MAAAGAVRYVVTERGYDGLRDKLKNHEELFGEPYRGAMASIGRAGATSAQAGAPIGPSGRTVNNIKVATSRAKIPRFVRIVESARSNTGFAYPRVLEFSLYAQSRYKKGSNKHKLWMKRAIDRIVPLIDAAFKAAADGVERKWES